MGKATHEWDDNLETCIKCGDKDWMADDVCSESRVEQAAFTVVAGKYEDDDITFHESAKYISEPMVYKEAQLKLKEVSDYPFSRVEFTPK